MFKPIPRYWFTRCAFQSKTLGERRRLIWGLFFLFLLNTARGQGTKRPNIVLISTDDLDSRSLQHFPKIQQHLSENGMEFRNSFVTTPVCGPSRASLLTGMYAHNHGIRIHGLDSCAQKFKDTGLESKTMAALLKESGYRTVLVGKYLNDYPGKESPARVPEGWSEFYGYLLGGIYYNFRLSENGIVRRYDSSETNYLTDVMARTALDFVRRSAGSIQPFFMYIGMIAPHNDVVGLEAIPPYPARRHENAFMDASLAYVPSYDEDDVSDKPQWIRAMPRLAPDEHEFVRSYYRRRLQSMLAVDEFVDSLVTVLRDQGVLDNTYIIFTSDNGFHMGEHRLRPQKGTAYDEDIRVPLMIRGPEIKAGIKKDDFTLNIDLAPTVLELAGVQIPQYMDGRSLVPHLRGQPIDTWRTAFLVEFWRLNAEYATPTYVGVRTRDLSYTVYQDDEVELYDMIADPFQLINSAAFATTSTLKFVRESVLGLSDCVGADCFSSTERPTEVIPVRAGITRVFPQPVGSTAMIQVDLSDNAKIEASIYSITGEKVEDLISGHYFNGSYYLTWRPDGLSNGVYVYRVTINGRNFSGKLLLLK